MLDPSKLIIFASASMILAITPGPDIIYTLARGITQGRKAALYAAMGFNIGPIFHTICAAIGLSAVLRSSALAYQGIKYLGAAYLIYIGIQTWRSHSLTPKEGKTDFLNPKAIFKQTIICNILNPKVALFFLAFLPQFVDPAEGSVGIQMILLGVLFIIVCFPVFALVALFSGTIGDHLKKNPKIEGRLKKAAGGVLVSLGLTLAIPESR